uniref:ZZ-type domain-containing protein n=1 Tax=Trichuris muris TaxID=70415 RepID=A0A5S6QZN2_TRIMR
MEATVTCSNCIEPIVTWCFECCVCCDLKLCISCFRCGAELGSHRRVHNYRVRMIDGPAIFLPEDNDFLREPWVLKEELRLLETVEAFNLGYWQDVQRCINPKRKSEELSCHYENCFLNGRLGKEVLSGLTYAQLTDHTNSSCASEVPQADSNGYSKHSAHDLRLLAYMPQRDDFEKEFLNDAECLISNLLYISDRREIEREAQLSLISMYIQRLNERRKCKQLIGEYDLITQFLKEERPCGIGNYWKYSPADVRRMKEERELKESFRRFCQFVPASELDALISNLMKERAVKSRIEELQEYCKNGVTTLKGKREFDLNLTPRRRRKNRRLRFSHGQKRNVKSWLRMRHRQKRYFDVNGLTV